MLETLQQENSLQMPFTIMSEHPQVLRCFMRVVGDICLYTWARKGVFLSAGAPCEGLVFGYYCG